MPPPPPKASSREVHLGRQSPSQNVWSALRTANVPKPVPMLRAARTEDVTLDRGDFWQDESLLQMEGKKFDKKQARHISGLRSGRAGCKVSVLQAQAASKALKGSGATGPAATGGVRVGRVRARACAHLRPRACSALTRRRADASHTSALSRARAPVARALPARQSCCARARVALAPRARRPSRPVAIARGTASSPERETSLLVIVRAGVSKVEGARRRGRPQPFSWLGQVGSGPPSRARARHTRAAIGCVRAPGASRRRSSNEMTSPQWAAPAPLAVVALVRAPSARALERAARGMQPTPTCASHSSLRARRCCALARTPCHCRVRARRPPQPPARWCSQRPARHFIARAARAGRGLCEHARMHMIQGIACSWGEMLPLERKKRRASRRRPTGLRSTQSTRLWDPPVTARRRRTRMHWRARGRRSQ